ncbi:hypothetical protein VNO77_19416 [Canavalia gladiata]|uniref:Uncharacterized protein n=1 Tax=Canavalia gladiata TaxID=3824 RepID=A0AAN9LME7_CANGL
MLCESRPYPKQLLYIANIPASQGWVLKQHSKVCTGAEVATEITPKVKHIGPQKALVRKRKSSHPCTSSFNCSPTEPRALHLRLLQGTLAKDVVRGGCEDVHSVFGVTMNERRLEK